MIKVLCDAKGCKSEVEVPGGAGGIGLGQVPSGWAHVHFTKRIPMKEYNTLLMAQEMAPETAGWPDRPSRRLSEDDEFEVRIDALLCQKHPLPELHENVQSGVGGMVVGRHWPRLRPVS